MSVVEAGHLGGYIPGGDPNTHCPELWKWFRDELGVKRVVDVGCGDGAALNGFNGLGMDAIGIDGTSQDRSDIVQHDYTTGPLELDTEYDLAWSAEFVEHVEEQHVPNFLATFKAARYVAMTHGTPGQPGWHHVNCQPAAYWIGRLGEAGFDHSPLLTLGARLRCSQESYFFRTGLVFKRSEVYSQDHERNDQWNGDADTR